MSVKHKAIQGIPTTTKKRNEQFRREIFEEK